MQKNKFIVSAFLAVSLALTTGCRTMSPQAKVLAEDAASNTFGQNLEIILDNEAAFQKRIELIDKATTSIDMAYFIFGNDKSSSLLMMKLLDKAKSGVKVRLLLDSLLTIKNREYFQALQSASNGNLEVIYFRPPPQEVWADLKTWGFPDRDLFLEQVGNPKGEGLVKLVQSNPVYKKSKALRLLVARFYPATMTPQLAASVALDYARGKTVEDILRADFENVKKELSGATLHTHAWITAGKRLHHKLLVTDQRFVMGGGRNIGDHYHLRSIDTKDPDYIHFDDADFVVDSPVVAKTALAFVDDLWTCSKTPTNCRPAIAVEAEKSIIADQAAVLIDKLATNAKDYEQREQLPSTRPTFKAASADVRYLENRMYPQFRGAEKVSFGEEESRYNLETKNLIDATKANQEIVFHNAYIFFTPMIFKSLLDAAQRGVKITIYGNSRHSPDQGYLTLLTLPQYSFLKAWAKKHNNTNIKIYQYTAARSSIHNKVALIGDYMIVGSTNLDPRSQFLDTQNGLLIAPGKHTLVKQYRDWLGTLRNEKTRYPNGTEGSRIVEVTDADLTKQVPTLAATTADPKAFSEEQKMLARISDLHERAFGAETSESELYRAIISALFLNI